MKRIVIATAIGLACIGSAYAADPGYTTANIDSYGYSSHVFVATSQDGFMRAQRLARIMEAQRELGVAPLTIVPVVVYGDQAFSGRELLSSAKAKTPSEIDAIASSNGPSR